LIPCGIGRICNHKKGCGGACRCWYITSDIAIQGEAFEVWNNLGSPNHIVVVTKLDWGKMIRMAELLGRCRLRGDGRGGRHNEGEKKNWILILDRL